MSLIDDDHKRALVQGRGTYVADIDLPGMLHASFVRSYLAAGQIRGHHRDDALAFEGTRAVYVGSDLAAATTPLGIEGTGHVAHDWVPLAVDRVRFVGEAVAVVVADDPYVAEDAAEAVLVDLEPEPPVVDMDEAMADGTRIVNAQTPTNVIYEVGQSGGDVDETFRDAPVVIERTFRHGRQTPFPLETRGVVARHDPVTDQLTVWTSTQIPHIVRDAIATALKRDPFSVRVITPDVGGAFGLKATVFPEEITIAWVAIELGRPICWIEDRRENLTASTHAHEEKIVCRLAADSAGNILGLDVDVTVDVGAYSTYPTSAALEPLTTMSYVLAGYRVPAIRVVARAVTTNKCPGGAYRGVGMPPGVFAGERLLDVLSQEIGADRIDLRLRNLVRQDEMPYTTALGVTWDDGDYPGALRAVLDETDYSDLMQQRATRDQTGPLLGVGIVVFNEHSGTGSRTYRGRGLKAIPGFDGARLTLQRNGRLRLDVSSADSGQDHPGAFRNAVEFATGIAGDLVDVAEGDTAHSPSGSGTFASRSASAQATAVAQAARTLANDLIAAARRLLETEVPLEVAGGIVRSADGAEIGLAEIADALNLRDARLDGLPPILEATAYNDMPIPTYPYGAHLAVVEFDPATMQARVDRYVGFEDCGVVLNEPAVHEQVLGGIAMGLGCALLEEHHYSDEGQIQSTTLLDYLVPLATDMPTITLLQHETPTDRTALGSRGVAESGTIGAIAAIGTAVADALSQLGAEVNVLPATPGRLFNAIATVRTA